MANPIVRLSVLCDTVDRAARLVAKFVAKFPGESLGHADGRVAHLVGNDRDYLEGFALRLDSVDWVTMTDIIVSTTSPAMLGECSERDAHGDPRRCPRHGCRTSSDNGLFDAPCPVCEDELWWEAQEES